MAEGRLGVALDEPVDAARRSLEDAVAEACAEDPWLARAPGDRASGGAGSSPPGRLPADSDLAVRMGRAHDRAGGGPQEVWGAPYGSDLRLLTAAGVPTLHYGPGDSALAHAADERVPLAELHTATRALALLALDVCGLA